MCCCVPNQCVGWRGRGRGRYTDTSRHLHHQSPTNISVTGLSSSASTVLTLISSTVLSSVTSTVSSPTIVNYCQKNRNDRCHKNCHPCWTISLWWGKQTSINDNNVMTKNIICSISYSRFSLAWYWSCYRSIITRRSCGLGTRPPPTSTVTTSCWTRAGRSIMSARDTIIIRKEGDLRSALII